MGYEDYYRRLYRDYYRDPFPHSLLRTRQSLGLFPWPTSDHEMTASDRISKRTASCLHVLL